MGRKPIMANQRSIPVSFSVKPALYDRIENMAYDQRFTRSKFLQEAVLRYINFIQNKETTQNIADMPLQQKVIIGINALQSMNADGEELTPAVYEMMKKQIEIYDLKTVVRRVDEKEIPPKVATSAVRNPADITFIKVRGRKEYQIFNHGNLIGFIGYDLTQKSWVTSIGNDWNSHRTLKHAKATVVEEWE